MIALSCTFYTCCPLGLPRESERYPECPEPAYLSLRCDLLEQCMRMVEATMDRAGREADSPLSSEYPTTDYSRQAHTEMLQQTW